MKNDVEAYRAGDKLFEFKQTNGLFTTVETSSSDVKPSAQASTGAKVQMLVAGGGQQSSRAVAAASTDSRAGTTARRVHAGLT